MICKPEWLVDTEVATTCVREDLTRIATKTEFFIHRNVSHRGGSLRPNCWAIFRWKGVKKNNFLYQVFTPQHIILRDCKKE